MTAKEKLTLSVGILVSLIIGLLVLSVISLQILTATEPTSPVVYQVQCYGCRRRYGFIANYKNG